MKRRMTKDGAIRPVRNSAPAGLDRRDFIKASALVAGAGVWVATGQRVLGVEEQSANDKISVASIGVGGKGDSDSEHAGKHANMVAICDIDEDRLNSKAKKFPKAKKYTDFRKMFDEMGKEIDALTVSTPDHTHAVATMMALKMGKHVYCQKPLTHDVWEARMIREAAAKAGVSTQMGNQGTANHRFREGVDTIRAGTIGTIKEVHIWTNRPIWPQAPQVMARLPEESVPEKIHWDNFLGTAPDRPYNKEYTPFKWRGWWDFGTGALGDMGCHTANMPFMALKLHEVYPTSIQGECGDLNPETYPSWAHVVFEFPARGELPPVTVHWYEGRKDGDLVHPPKELTDNVIAEYTKLLVSRDDKRVRNGKKIELINSGSITVGDKGMIYSPDDYGGVWDLVPFEQFKDFKGVEQVLPRNGHGGDEDQKIEWLNAARDTSKPSLANFAYAGKLAEFILLGNIAIKNPGRKLEWDGPNLTFTNYKEADRLLKREYRAPWTL